MQPAETTVRSPAEQAGPRADWREAADSIYLSRFSPLHAARVASWVRTSTELMWLAPGTVPPLTSEKVSAWGLDRPNRFLLGAANHAEPGGYAELNYMPTSGDQMWVGHFLVDPELRGRRVGTRFAAALVNLAFRHFRVNAVLLVVFPQNAHAIRCYERAGMKRLGEEAKHFPETGRTHTFARMGIDLDRYEDLVADGQLSGRSPIVRY